MTRPVSLGKALSERVETVRGFNRFYTKQIGVLDQGHLNSEYSLAEVRVMYELAHWDDEERDPATATDIGRALSLDAGYLSRLLRTLDERGLVDRKTSAGDGRQQQLRLTSRGKTVYSGLDERARTAVVALLKPLSDDAQRSLVDALGTARALLDPDGSATPDRDRSQANLILREPQSGDFGWVVARHGILFGAEYGWDERFEGLVAGIVAGFIEHRDRRLEHCWIAEHDGSNAGSIFLVKHPDRPGVAKLRLLLVEPSARGLGIGARLVDECTRFARQAGYHTITLWTNSILTSAIRIYEAAGYELVDETPFRGFGHSLIGQTWELKL
jgi:DNA-binding MarR family transcriptional regulator/GNAT superfamily N-acetyltransferase